MQKGSEERSMRQEQQPIYVRSCCKTVHTFRNLKRSGRTGKQGDLENQKLYRSIRWMMRSMSCSISLPCPYGRQIEVADGITIKFTDIGHLLGSSSIEVWLREADMEKPGILWRCQTLTAIDQRSRLYGRKQIMLLWNLRMVTVIMENIRIM